MENLEYQHDNTKNIITISDISDALSDVFKGKDIKSQELMDEIFKIYFLIELIVKHSPSELKAHLFMWPSDESEIFNFIENLKKEYAQDDYSKDIINEILDFYLEFFERWGDDCLNQWRKIVRNYNPSRINELKRAQFKGGKIEAARNEIMKKYHPEKIR